MAVIDQEIEGTHAVYNADCMEVLPTFKSESIGISVYSPAFPELYVYSNDPRDMSNVTTYEEGIEHYNFLVNQIARLTKPGRMTCVHCMDLKKTSTTQRDFPGDIVRVHEANEFGFFCRVTIWKDPWEIARRTRVRSLQHKSIVTGNFKVRVAGPDYVLVFVKGGKDDEKIGHPTGLMKYAGANKVPESFITADGKTRLAREFYNFKGDQRTNLLSHWIWRQYASPVWMDIRGGRLLSKKDTKETEEENHVCPLQLDVIERMLTLWSNEGDTMLTPHAGIGSEVYMALRMGRKPIATELKSTYYRQILKNCKRALEVDTADEGTFEFNDEPETAENKELIEA